MRSKNNKIPARFAPTVSFAVESEPEDQPPINVEKPFNALKDRLVEEAVTATPVIPLQRLFKLAGHEAAGVAWTTGVPLLVFPVLFAELTSRIRTQYKHQQEVQLRSELMLEQVA